MQTKTVKLPKENEGENVSIIEFGNAFYNRTEKAEILGEINKLDSGKIFKTFVLWDSVMIWKGKSLVHWKTRTGIVWGVTFSQPQPGHYSMKHIICYRKPYIQRLQLEKESRMVWTLGFKPQIPRTGSESRDKFLTLPVPEASCLQKKGWWYLYLIETLSW